MGQRARAEAAPSLWRTEFPEGHAQEGQIQ